MERHKESSISLKDRSKSKETKIKSNKSWENKGKERQILLSIDIQLDGKNSKKFELNKLEDLNSKLNSFCIENNLPESAKKYIYNIIMEKIKIGKTEECKYKLYLSFSRGFNSKKYKNSKTIQ